MKKNETRALKVEKREYFCIVKQLEGILRTTFVTILLIMTSGVLTVPAQESCGDSVVATNMSDDSVSVSLLTCSPHDAIYSLYGHTAIRYRNLRTGDDWVFNYGIFNFKKPFFVLRFALGQTDYELGVIPFHIFEKEYKRFGCQVNEQILNIGDEDKTRIMSTLDDNLRPENRIYRYNFFYNNCTTRARDVIEDGICGKVVYAWENTKTNTTKALSFRDAIHIYTAGHPWAALGNDLALGSKADADMTPREQQFLPENLMKDFDGAKICSDGKYRPLIKSNRIIIEKNAGAVNCSTGDIWNTIFTPTLCALIFMALSIIIAYCELKRGKTFVVWDVFNMTATGVSGLIILLLFFSEHPATSTNLQILTLNPMSLFFIPAVVKRKKTSYWRISAILLILFWVLFPFQSYAEGMIIVALSLLIRNWINLRPVSNNSHGTNKINNKNARD